MMKKRMLAMALTGAMCASLLAGCGSDAEAQSGENAADATYNVAMIVKLTDSHFNKVMAGAQAYADEHSNVTVDIQSPTSATGYDEQLNMIETTLSNASYDAVIISPQQSDTAGTLVANTDKVIIALDTDFESDKKAAFVGTGNQEAAKAVGKLIAERALAHGITEVVFDRGGHVYHGRIKALAEAAREAGLKF